MFDRKEAKAKAKIAFKANYWRTVLVTIILLAIIGTGAATFSGATSRGVDNYEVKYDVEVDDDAKDYEVIFDALGAGMALAIIGAIVLVLIFGCIFAIALDIFLWNPIEVGCRKFLLENSDVPANLGELAYGFDHGYLRTVRTIFRRDLYLTLWTLLFFIPGIIKYFSYMMVPYILIDNPDMDSRQVIEASRQMMKGHKWEAFVLDLSFILWELLSGLTFGIAGVFFVNPYVACTHAEFYKQLRDAD